MTRLAAAALVAGDTEHVLEIEPTGQVDDTRNLGQAGDAFQHASHAIIRQRDESSFMRDGAQFIQMGAAGDHRIEFAVDAQQFHDGHAAAIAGVAATLAAFVAEDLVLASNLDAKQLAFVLVGRVGLLALAQALGEALREDPSLANKDPMGNGWFFKVHVTHMEQFDELMDPPGYDALLKTL